MRWMFCAAVSIGWCAIVTPARATVSVAVDLSHQTMHVQSAHGTYDWPISSARSGFSTPHGSYAPTRMELMHYSHKYHMSPMPHAIFFRGGYAIHGTYATADLGRPASHGCVRLSPGNAAKLYDMVKAEGARISISGAPPASGRPASAVIARGDVTVRVRHRGRDDLAALGARPRPVMRAQTAGFAGSRDETAHPGYRFMGRVGGRRVYQAVPDAAMIRYGYAPRPGLDPGALD